MLLSWRGDVKLTDFGIARAAERRHKTEAGTLKGKYGYMSPEQVSGGEIDPRSDLFSVGILLAEMVMARRLFTSTNDLDILLMVRDARLDRLHKYASEFPLELRVLTVRALQRRPEDRWQTAARVPRRARRVDPPRPRASAARARQPDRPRRQRADRRARGRAVAEERSTADERAVAAR